MFNNSDTSENHVNSNAEGTDARGSLAGTEELRRKVRQFLRDGRMVFESHGPEETRLLGRVLGENGMPGQVYTLTGDLGVGKTLFTQGFAEGLGISEPVSSPTFTIMQMYETGRLPFYHYDVYRIADAEEMEEVGWEDYIYGDGVCMVEWAERIREILPKDRFCIRMEKDLEKGFDYRRITLEHTAAKQQTLDERAFP